MRRRFGVLLGIVAMVAGLQTVSASAAWQSSGTGSAYAKAATLGVPTPTIGAESCSGLLTKTGTMSVTWPAAANATSYDLVWWPNSSGTATVSPATSPTSIAYNFGLLGLSSVTISVQVRAKRSNWIGAYTSPPTQRTISCGLL